MSSNRDAIRYAHLGYVAPNVTDLERSAWFYEHILGLTSAGAIADGRPLFRCGGKHHDVVLSQAAWPGLKRIGWRMESFEARAARRFLGAESEAARDG